MRRVPRDEWLEWCYELSHGRRRHLEISGLGVDHGVVRLIDYAPFDDILELDIEDHGAISRRLIDHPVRIWIQEAGRTGEIVIESPTETVPLVVFDTPAPPSGGYTTNIS